MVHRQQGDLLPAENFRSVAGWRWKLDGGAPVQISHAEHNVQSFQLSGDGSQIAMEVEKPYTADRQQLAERGF